jgi:Holliday junction resolvase RusA-like endonuclease
VTLFDGHAVIAAPVALPVPIRFSVHGVPKSMRVGGVARFLRAGKMHTVPVRENSEWALIVGKIARDHAPAKLLDGPVRLTLAFFMPKPKSAPKHRRVWPITRPDADNLFHKLTDAMNGVLWTDDSVIVEVHLTKDYSPSGFIGLDVTVEQLTP